MNLNDALNNCFNSDPLFDLLENDQYENPIPEAKMFTALCKDIVFLQNDEAKEAFEMIDRDINEAFEHLKQWDMGDSVEGYPCDLSEYGRTVNFEYFENRTYFMIWDHNLDYVSLTKII
jgi:hypothetical protein